MINWPALAEFTIRVVSILVPPFYNRITWLVVSAGVAIVAKPLFETLVTLLIGEAFAVQLIGPNDSSWGFALVALGLVYHFSSTALIQLTDFISESKRETRRAKHDLRIFLRANKILSTDELSDFLDWLQNNHSYDGSELNKIREHALFLMNDDNKFLNTKLIEATDKYLNSIARIINFVSYNFFVHPPNQRERPFQYCMYPDLNIDRGGAPDPELMARYDDYSRELDEVANEVREFKRIWRRSIKETLTI